MTDNKFRMKEKPGLSDAFVGMDYEIKPKMVEVWNGKRIAWTVAIISALLLIPIVYLIYNSYWNDAQEQSQITSENALQSHGLQPQSPSKAKPPVVITAPESGAQTDASTLQPVIDDETRARIARQSLEEVSANIVKPLIETDETTKTSTKQMETLAANTKSKAITPKLESSEITTAARQELSTKTKQVSPGTSRSSTTASPPPVQTKPQQNADTSKSVPVNQADHRSLNNKLDEQQFKAQAETLATDVNKPDTQIVADQVYGDADEQLDNAYNEKSEHVSRVHLVSAVRNLEPVGEDMNTLTIQQGQSRNIVYFTEVQGLYDRDITYRWLREGKLAFSKTIPVTGNHTWRSYIKKSIRASMAGNWIVELRDDQENILSQHSFEVVQLSE